MPRKLLDVIDVMPEIVENCLSSGVATEDAIVSGLAPGKLAETWIVGKSTLGNALTANLLYPVSPDTIMAQVSNVVKTGRLIQNSEMFILLMFLGLVGAIPIFC
jgi:hypothetical protein